MSQWPTVALGEVCEKRPGTRNPKDDPDTPFLYVDISSVDNEAKAITEPKKLLGGEAPSRARRIIRAGDVIVSMTRPNLNAVGLVPPDLDDQVCSTGFSVLRPNGRALSEYIFHFTRSKRFVETLSGAVSGAMYPAVTEGQVKAVTLPLPPLSEQRRIIDILNRANGIRRLRQEAQEKAQQVIPALFAEMFGDPQRNPKGWPMTRLDQAVAFVSGATPSRKEPAFWDGYVPWVSAKDMKQRLISSSADRITTQALNSIPRLGHADDARCPSLSSLNGRSRH